MRTLAHTLSVFLATLALPVTALAQQAAADALFDSARAAMSKGDFAAACRQFRASDQLDTAVGTELNLADCEEKRGHLATAWELYRRVLDKLAENDERLPLAHARAQALAPRVPRLTLELALGAPKDSSVRDGDVALGSGAFGVALPLEPGAHELVVSAPGFEPRSFQVRLVEGQTQALIVAPGSAVAEAKATAPSRVTTPAQPDEATHASSGRRTLGFVLGGVGVAGLGVGAVAGLLELGRKHTVNDQCQSDKSCTSAGLSAADSGRSLEMVSNVGWIVGAVALGAGAYFLLSHGSSSEPRTALSVSSRTAGGQLSLSRTW